MYHVLPIEIVSVKCAAFGIDGHKDVEASCGLTVSIDQINMISPQEKGAVSFRSDLRSSF